MYVHLNLYIIYQVSCFIWIYYMSYEHAHNFMSEYTLVHSQGALHTEKIYMHFINRILNNWKGKQYGRLNMKTVKRCTTTNVQKLYLFYTFYGI